MQHKFYPSLLGRCGYLIAALLLGALFMLPSIFIVFPAGEMFAADSFEFIDLVLLLLSLSVAFLLGLASLYYLINAISPYPFLIIDTEREEIHIRVLGTFGHVKMKWHAIRHAKPKGFLKYLYLQILIPQQLNIKHHQNIVFRFAFGALKNTYYLVRLKFTKFIKTEAQQFTNPDIIHLYRTSVSVPLSKIEKILDERFKEEPIEDRSPVPTIATAEKAVIRIRPGEYSRSLGKTLNMFFVFVVCVLPLFLGFIGYVGYLIDSQTDSKMQEAQSLRSKAVAGDADSQNQFGERLRDGIGVPQSNARANRWLRKAAKQRHFKAQYNLGLSYNCDHLRKKKKKQRRDCKKAIDWFEKSANQGYYPAQTQMGYLNYHGLGIRQSYTRAFYWFSRSVKQNDNYALFFLGKLYENGNGVEKSTRIAIEKYKQASANGYTPATKALKRLGS